ncbi:MAG: hypothetical protein EPO08_14650 [Rhodospirillaceae bacterium]|nr:MAG: hypothetical protein EPO08_14650 [Rhodospirillaceae bacterium]
MAVTAKHYAEIYRQFQAPISKRYDCGKKCAPHNGGVPVCCDIDNAIPIVDKPEWSLLKSRTDLWQRLKPTTPSQRREVKSLEDSESCAIKCKGAAHCERDNRSLACRSFPYFPYFDPKGNLVGLAHYWAFEGQCWVIANPMIVDQAFVTEMVASHEYMFRHDKKWHETYVEFSASMRRVFSRRKKKFAVLGRDGGYFWVLPHSGGKMIPAKAEDLARLGKMFPEDPATDANAAA